MAYSVENIIGGQAADILIGSAQANVIHGGPGDDYIDGVAVPATGTAPTQTPLVACTSPGGGDVDAGVGNRLAFQASNGDQLFGDDGNDWFYMDSTANCGVTVVGGAGKERFDFSGRTSWSAVTTGAGKGSASTGLLIALDNQANDGDLNEYASIGKNGDVEVVLGSPGDDDMTADMGGSELHGGQGNDFLNGGAGPDTLVGGPGKDVILGNAGNDLINEGCVQDTQLPTEMTPTATSGATFGYLAHVAGFTPLGGFATGINCGGDTDLINGGTGYNSVTYGAAPSYYAAGSATTATYNGRVDPLTLTMCMDPSFGFAGFGTGGAITASACVATSGLIRTITGSVDLTTLATANFASSPAFTVTVSDGTTSYPFAVTLTASDFSTYADSEIVTLTNAAVGTEATSANVTFAWANSAALAVLNASNQLVLTMPATVTTHTGVTTNITTMTLTDGTHPALATLGLWAGASIPENDEIVNCNWIAGGSGDDTISGHSQRRHHRRGQR